MLGKVVNRLIVKIYFNIHFESILRNILHKASEKPTTLVEDFDGLVKFSYVTIQTFLRFVSPFKDIIK